MKSPKHAVENASRAAISASIVIVFAMLLAQIVDHLVNRTRFGRAIRAVSQDPDAATLMGVSKERIIMQTFLVGGLLAGAAALLYLALARPPSLRGH